MGQRQYLDYHCNGVLLRIARELIIQKLHGQEQVLKKFFQHSSASFQVLAEARRVVARANNKEEIRRWEAKGALAYWSAMREVPVNFSKDDSAKIPEHWKRFGS